MRHYLCLFIISTLLINCSSANYLENGVIIKREQHTVGVNKDYSPIISGAKKGGMVAAGVGGVIGVGVGVMAGSLSPNNRAVEVGLIGALGLGAIFGVIGATTGAINGILAVLFTPQEKDTWVYTVKSLNSSKIYVTKPQSQKLNNDIKVKLFNYNDGFTIKPVSYVDYSGS